MTSVAVAPNRAAESARIEESAGTKRSGFIEVVRVMSCVNVVICHVTGQTLGGAFLLAALSIALTARPDGGIELVLSRAKRLLLPWLFWSMLYGVDKVRHEGWSALKPEMIIAGPSLHLWYLPFAFLAFCAVTMCLRLARGWLTWAIAAAAALIGCGLLLPFIGNLFPLPQWLLGTAAVLLGCAFSRIRAASDTAHSQVGWAPGIFGLAVVIAGLTSGWEPLLPAIIGATLLGLAWTVRFPAPRWLTYCAGLGYGVYLIHPFVMHALCHIPGVIRHPALQIFLEVIGAALVTSIIQKTRFKQLV